MQALNYNQVTLIPNKCIVKSRSECDTSIDFCGYKFNAPIVPANMTSVINEDIAKWLAFNNFFYIYHRFGNTRQFIQRARGESWPLVSISVGVKDADKELIEDIAQSKCRVHFVTIDIAHGYSDSVATMIAYIKSALPGTKVIAGNVWGDKKSIEFLQESGADAIKVGLSCGAGCSTFAETAFGSPMFTAAREAGHCARVPVILDGGVRTNGDIARAIVGFMEGQWDRYTYDENQKPIKEALAGIPIIMAGSIFAACVDAPGENSYGVEIDDALKQGYTLSDIAKEIGHAPLVKYKKYYGSASAESKKKTGQEIKHVEGKTVKLECNGLTYEQKYTEIIGAVQSQISYAGGKDLLALKDVSYRTIN